MVRCLGAILVFGLSLLVFSCYSDPERSNDFDPVTWNVKYPGYGFYGENVLELQDDQIAINTSYSLYVKITGYSVVTISITYPGSLSAIPSAPARSYGRAESLPCRHSDILKYLGLCNRQRLCLPTQVVSRRRPQRWACPALP